tara:strand:+ start:531 stop:1043 length:513 start_codon:yes stop_codon:yes gene_type:complete
MSVTDLKYQRHRNLILDFVKGTAKEEDTQTLLSEAFAYPDATIWSKHELSNHLADYYKLQPTQIEDFMANCPMDIRDSKEHLKTPMPVFEGKDSEQAKQHQNCNLEARYHLKKSKSALSSGALFPKNYETMEGFYQAFEQRRKIEECYVHIERFLELDIENTDLYLNQQK